MIKFPATLTPVPKLPGYFWDVNSHKLYSIKIAGILRELKLQRFHPSFRYNRGTRLKPGDLYYALSHLGRRQYMPVSTLKKLKLLDYTMPVHHN
jgi:hypothetical protein